jgi:hypothetical protein
MVSCSSRVAPEPDHSDSGMPLLGFIDLCGFVRKVAWNAGLDQFHHPQP